MPPPKKIFGILSCILSIFLIFFAESLKENSLLLVSLLLLLSLLSLLPPLACKAEPLGLGFNLKRRFFSHRISFPLQCLGLLCIFFSFAWAPFYFSDDALRHIHDGFYIARGADIYSKTPEALEVPEAEEPVEAKPTHPKLGSIYLPLTQAQALLGAWLPIKHGFRFVYIFFCVLLLAFLWLLEKEPRKDIEKYDESPSENSRGALSKISFCLHPYFLIFLASHHADLQGFLLLLLVRAGLELYFGKKIPSHPLCFCLAFCTGLLAGLKPEGMIWLIYLSLHFLSKSYFSSSVREGRPGIFWKASLFWFAGLTLALGLQLSFSLSFLFPSLLSFHAFQETALFFLNWFLAYNPILELRSFLYETEGIARPEIFSHYRKQVYAVGLLSFFLVPGLLLLHRKRARLILGRKGKTQLSTELLTQTLLSGFLGIGLCVSIAMKGVWHPWYLLWLLPALWYFPDYKRSGGSLGLHIAHFLTGVIPLFYIPVVQLRMEGMWERQDFYGFYLALIAMGIFYFFRKALR